MAPLGAMVDGQNTAERADLSPLLQILGDNDADRGYLPVNTRTGKSGYLPLPSESRDAASTSRENGDAAAANNLTRLSGDPEQPAAVTDRPVVRVPIRRVVRVRSRGHRRPTTTHSRPSVQNASSSTEAGVTDDVAPSSTAPVSTEVDTDMATVISAPPASNWSSANTPPKTRRKIMKKRVRVISHKSVEESVDRAEVSITTETDEVVTTEAPSDSTTKTATQTATETATEDATGVAAEVAAETAIEADTETFTKAATNTVTIASPIAQYPQIRQRGRKRNTKLSSSSTSTLENPSTTLSGGRRVIRRRGRISSGGGTHSVSVTTSNDLPTGSQSPTKRRRIIRRKKGSSVTAGTASSSPTKKRRARRPLDSVSSLEATSGGVPSVRPLLVRPRVARHDGADEAPDAPVIRRIILRQGRGSESASSPATSSSGSQEGSNGTRVVTKKIIRRRGRARNLDASSSLATVSQQASISASPDSPAPTRRRVRDGGRARQRPAEEAATLADFTGGGVSLVRPLVFRPRIARARSAAATPGGITIAGVSPGSGPARQQVTRRRVIRRRGGQGAPTAATAAVGQPVVTVGVRDNDGGQRPGRRILRRRRPSSGSSSIASVPATTPSQTLRAVTAASAEKPEVVVITQQSATANEQPTFATQLSFTNELPKPNSPTGLAEQPNAPFASKPASDVSTTGFTGGSTGLRSTVPQGRRYQVTNRGLSSTSTGATLAPASRARKASRPKSSLRGTFAKADRVHPAPPPQGSQSAALPPPQPAVSNPQSHPEAEANTNDIEELRSTLPAGGDTVFGDRPVSQFSCDGRPYGYFADMEAECQVFHICSPVLQTNGVQQMHKHSFFCNNGTVFDQRTLSCRVTSAALPCERADEFYASVNFFSQYNYFDRLRQDQELREERVRRQQQKHHQQQRLETLEDLERLEAQLT